MTKFFLGLVSGVVLIFLLGFVLLVLLFVLAAGGGSQPAIADGSVLHLDLKGAVPEHHMTNFSLDWIESGPPPTVLGMRQTILRAADDDRIAALSIECGGLAVGWAKAQEIRWAIEKFKESGKPVVAYMQVAGMLDYFVAGVADEVYLFPEGILDVKGLRAEVSFFKDTLEKIGVEAEMERVGRYKNAVEPYSRSTMSDDFREVLDSMLDEMLALFLETAAPAREMTVEQMRAALDEGPFLPAAAEELGLVDGLLYPDQLRERLEELLEVDELEAVAFNRYAADVAGAFELPGGDQIAIVYGVGAIMRGKTQNDPFFGSNVLGADSFSSTLRKLRKNDDVKAVIVRIDSPGGDAIASDQMWRELKLLRAEKPVVISMSDVAASGGYYMAMAEDTPVLAYPGTVTGSIGVFFGKMNLAGLYEKIGVHKEILTRGRFAAIETDARGLTDAERAKLRESVEAFYQAFVQKVAEARGASWDEIHEVAQGRVWMGSQALERGLIDETAGLERAIELAKLAAGVEEDADIKLVPYPKAKNLLETFLEQNMMIFAPQPPVKLGLPPALPALLKGGLLTVWDGALEIR